jgi:diguanylate cyclase (GGDEF)-like protein/PAS domain S-box-containing protein
MILPADLPLNEQQRLIRLRKLMVLDTLPEGIFDEITKLASEICGTPIALISLVDANRQWFKSNVGLEGTSETPRDIAFCSHTILTNELEEVQDATLDHRFKNNPLVTAEPHIRFYAGVPISTPDGENVGSLCVIDRKSRQLTPTQKTILTSLSKLVAKALVEREQILFDINNQTNQFTNIIESSDDAIISKSVDSIVLTWNLGAEKIFGYTSDEMVGQPITKLFPDNRLNEEIEFVDKIKKKQRVKSFETERITKQGKLIYVSVTLSPILDPHGELIGVSKIARDITAHKKAEIAFAHEHERLRVTMDSIGDAVITINSKGLVEYLNPIAEKLTGWLTGEAKGMPLSQVFNIINESTRKPSLNPVDICLLENRIVGLANHTILISRNGSEYGIEDSASPIRSAEGKTLGVVLVFHDVTVQRQMANEMTYRATHDALTGLINRGEFEHRLERLLIHTHPYGNKHALMFIDLDQFKVVNDTCGHTAGDELLKEITHVIEQCVRTSDTLARVGGDEFAVILEKCDAEPAMRIAQLICKNVDEYRFKHQEKRFRIGTSIGLVIMDSHWSSIQTLMQAADTACYTAKEAGRNRVHLYYDTDYAVETRRGEIQWAGRIEQAIEDNQFVLFCQRILPLRKNGGLHAEVLIRLKDANGNIISPGTFLPAAERFHMASRVDNWVVKSVFLWLQHNQNKISHIDSISINLSGQSIGDEAFHDYILMLIGSIPIDFSKVCFEITETATITNIHLAKSFIQIMKSHQIKFSLDDFGSGVSSFGYLKSLDVDYLKIDGQFIKKINEDPVDLATVRCILEIAKVTGKKTIAEWVETVEVETILRRLGADYTQGYLRHEPEPIDQMLIAERQTTDR